MEQSLSESITDYQRNILGSYKNDTTSKCYGIHKFLCSTLDYSLSLHMLNLKFNKGPFM